MSTTNQPIRPYVPPENYEERRSVLMDTFHGPELADDTLRARAGQVPKAMAQFNAATQQNINALELRMQISPPQSAWVVNIHPFPIICNGGRYLHDIVPGCEIRETNPDELCCAFVELPWWDMDMRPQVDGSFSVDPFLPITQAGQYMREANTNELWGPGVMIYEGANEPEKMWEENTEIVCFTDRGWPITQQIRAKVRQRGSRELVDGVKMLAATKPFRQIYTELRQRRNDRYLTLVTEADEKYHSAKPDQKNWYVDKTLRLMARVLVAEKILPKLPAWNLETTIDIGLTDEKCRGCGTARPKDANLCVKCGKPFDLLIALRNGDIDFDYVGLKFLPPEQLAEVMRLKKEVEKNHRDAGLILAREAKEQQKEQGS